MMKVTADAALLQSYGYLAKVLLRRYYKQQLSQRSRLHVNFIYYKWKTIKVYF